MKIVLQRVSNASVTIRSKMHSQIGKGFLILVGITQKDTIEDVEWMARKVIALRVFSDDEGKMNLSLSDIDGEILVISQFTLHASTEKGNRPNFINAARADVAVPIYEKFVDMLSQKLNKNIAKGIFGADMKVALVNDGPVTIVLDSKNKE